MSISSRIAVAIRIRPMLKREKDNCLNNTKILVDDDEKEIKLILED